MLASPPEDFLCGNDDEANTAIAQAFRIEAEIRHEPLAATMGLP
jgi:hypothetical protein